GTRGSSISRTSSPTIPTLPGPSTPCCVWPTATALSIIRKSCARPAPTCSATIPRTPQCPAFARRPGTGPPRPSLPEGVDALLGGSFDPVHIGHLVVAEAAAEVLGTRIRFLPAREQPFKRAAHGATAEQRAAMLALAAAGNPRLAVEPIELTLPVPSYTVRTLRALADREGGNRFTLLLGADAAADLAAWHEVEALPHLADVVVFARPGSAPPAQRL